MSSTKASADGGGDDDGDDGGGGGGGIPPIHCLLSGTMSEVLLGLLGVFNQGLCQINGGSGGDGGIPSIHSLSSGTISKTPPLNASLIVALDMGKKMIHLVPMEVRDRLSGLQNRTVRLCGLLRHQLATGKEQRPRSCQNCLRRGRWHRNCSITNRQTGETVGGTQKGRAGGRKEAAMV